MKRREFITTLTTAAAVGASSRLFGQTASAATSSEAPHAPAKKSRPRNLWKRQPMSNPEKVALRYPPSDCEQWCLAFAAAESNPSCVIIGQDMGGIWFSPTAGRKWFTLPNEGLGTVNIQSLAIDPLDEKRWLAMCIKRTRGGRQGLFLSNDGGISWQQVMPWAQGGETPHHCRRIAFAPSSKNPALGYTTRWYAAWDSADIRYEKKYQGVPGLVMSDDGGETWVQLQSLPAEKFGALLNGLRVHPLNAEVLYGWGPKGLFRFVNASLKNAPVEFLSGKSGLPAGACYGQLYLSADGETLITAVHGKGIYKSVNGGAAWSELYAWKNVMSAWVNEGHPGTIFALSHVSGLKENQARVTHDGGATWIENASSESMPGEPVDAVWTSQVGGETKCFVFADPRDPLKALAHGRARWFRTEDGGRHWVPSNDYFAGNQFTANSAPQIFDPTNPLRYVIPMIDIGVTYTEDGGKTLQHLPLDKKKLGLGHTSSSAGAIHPDPAKRSILLCSGSSLGGVLIRSTDNCRSWTVIRPEVRRRPYIGFDAGDANYCYQSNERSPDGGETWVMLSTMPARTVITGVSLAKVDGRSVLYAVDLDKAEGVDGSFRQIWKSLDRGETWTKAVDADYNLNVLDPAIVFRVHPKNPHVIFTRTPEGSQAQVRRWDTSAAGQPTFRDLGLWEEEQVPGDLRLTNLALDATNSEVIYALISSDVIGHRVCMSTDGGVKWQDITSGLPLRTERRGLEVHPQTGVVYIGSGAGMFVRKPPYQVGTPDNTWDILDRAFPKWEDAHLFEPYKA